MPTLSYPPLNEVDRTELLALMNSDRIRAHLVPFERFSPATLEQWLVAKTEVDALPGCRVRAVIINGKLAGWCALQPDDDGFELAIIIEPAAWGAGKAIFGELMSWARALGHSEVSVNLLHTRRAYRFLSRMASSVVESEMLGHRFTRYRLEVP